MTMSRILVNIFTQKQREHCWLLITNNWCCYRVDHRVNITGKVRKYFARQKGTNSADVARRDFFARLLARSELFVRPYVGQVQNGISHCARGPSSSVRPSVKCKVEYLALHCYHWICCSHCTLLASIWKQSLLRIHTCRIQSSFQPSSDRVFSAAVGVPGQFYWQ